MEEIGIVTQVESDKATVKVSKKPECSKCGLCGMKKNATSIEFVAKTNEFEVNLGDSVLINIEKDFKGTGYILAFLVPLILIGVGLFIGYLLKSELYSLLIAVGLVLIWVPILAVIDKKLSLISGSTCVIKKVLKEDVFNGAPNEEQGERK
jgi:positive regulator of sigma E activity